MTMSRRTFTNSAVTSAALVGIGTKAKAAQYDVVVVGAGAAGLSATSALIKAGLSVVCVEAANRIGGRVHTDLSEFGIPFDQGAHWLHSAQKNPFVKLGKKLGFSLYQSPERYPVYENGSASTTAMDAFFQEADRVNDALSTAASQGHDIAGSKAVSDVNDWTLTAFTHIGTLSMARDMEQVSTADWYSAISGDDWFCKQGFGALLARQWKDVPVTLNTSVKSIEAADGGVTIETNSGTLRAKSAIVTVSLGVLTSGAIRFSPGFDEPVQSALNGFTMGSYNHIALRLSPGVLDVKPDSWISYQINQKKSGGPKGGGILGNINGSNLYYLEVGGRFGAALEHQGQKAMTDFAIEEFRSIFGGKTTAAITKTAATRWGKDPLVLGSYSGAVPGKAHLRKNLRIPMAERVFLAGEACSFGEQATVSGAHKDGLRAAFKVKELLSD